MHFQHSKFHTGAKIEFLKKTLNFRAKIPNFDKNFLAALKNILEFFDTLKNILELLDTLKIYFGIFRHPKKLFLEI